MVEKVRVTNSEVGERRLRLLAETRPLFERKFGKTPKVTSSNGYRMEFTLETPRSISKKTADSKLYGLVRRFEGMRTLELNHGEVDPYSTKIIGLGYVARLNESWLSLTIANGDRDPFAVWIGSKGEYVATNSMGNAKEIHFGNEYNPWLLGLFAEIEDVFVDSLVYGSGEIDCIDAPFSGWQLNKKN